MGISRIVEKPQEAGLGNYVLSGVFLMPFDLFELLEGEPDIVAAWEKLIERYGIYASGVFLMPFDLFELLEGEPDIVAAWEKLIERYGIYAAIWEKSWIDINYPWSILQANRMVMDTWDDSRIARSVSLAGGVTIEGTWDDSRIACSVSLAGGVTIEGPVIIEDDVRICEGAVIRGPVAIGRGISLAGGVTIEGPVIIEDDVRICEGAVIRGPVAIGRGSFIGNKALIREYSAIGPGSQIGFGTECKNCVIFGDATIGRISFVGDSVVFPSWAIPSSERARVSAAGR